MVSFQGKNERRAHAVRTLDEISRATASVTPPLSVSIIKEYGQDPFLLLISCLLSLRAKDSKTLPITRELFAHARTPQEILEIPLVQLEKLIYSIGFYKNKARTLRSVSADLIKRFGGHVPRTLPELLSIKGVGHKTANLILGMAYGIPAICVDVHVHRLANMLGLVHTKTPLETEKELEALLPKKYWIEVNHTLVALGQNPKIVVPRLAPDVAQKLYRLLPKKYRLQK